MSTQTRATIEDLYKVDGKAELVNGKIVHMAPTGGFIYITLWEHWISYTRTAEIPRASG